MLPTLPDFSMVPQNSTVVAAMRDFTSLYCVYEHHNAEGQIMYVGVCKLVEVYAFPDARQNSEWLKYFKGGEVIICKITMTSPNLHVCANMRQRQVMTTRPHCNVYGASYFGARGVKIICNETGEEFTTITEASRAHGISASHLSNHLNGKTGHRTVKGKTYRKGE